MEIIKAIKDRDIFYLIERDLEEGYSVYISVSTVEEDKIINKEINKRYKQFRGNKFRENKNIELATLHCKELATYRINSEREELGFDDLEFYQYHMSNNRFGNKHSFYIYKDNKMINTLKNVYW